LKTRSFSSSSFRSSQDSRQKLAKTLNASEAAYGMKSTQSLKKVGKVEINQRSQELYQKGVKKEKSRRVSIDKSMQEINKNKDYYTFSPAVGMA